MKSKYSGQCIGCKERFPEDSLIRWDSETKKCMHDHCVKQLLQKLQIKSQVTVAL